MTHSPNPTSMSREAEAEALSIGDFGLLLQDILRQFARDVEASPVRPGMSVEEFSPRFEAMRFASQAIVTAASRLRSHPATAGGKPGEGPFTHAYNFDVATKEESFRNLAVQTAASGAVELREALEAIKQIGRNARFRAPMPERDWKNTVVRMEREAEEALARPVAEEPAAPVEGEEIDRRIVAALSTVSIEDEAEDYEFRGDEGDHTPNENEKALLIDFAYGLMGLVHKAVRPLLTAAPKANGVGTGEVQS